MTDEIIVTQSSNKSLTLTNFRIIYERDELSNNYLQIIPLENIDSYENIYLHDKRLYFLAVLFIIAGALLFFYGTSYGSFGILIGFLFVAIYYLQSENLLIINSGNTKIKLRASIIGKSQIVQFLNQIECARLKMLEERFSKSTL